jgi:hypothetical protein
MIDINKERIAATFLSDLSRPQRESVLAILDELEDSRECVQNLLAENERLRADKKLLVGALRDLRDEQVGPPRPWDQEGWELAMNVSGALLEALEDDDE